MSSSSVQQYAGYDGTSDLQIDLSIPRRAFRQRITVPAPVIESSNDLKLRSLEAQGRWMTFDQNLGIVANRVRRLGLDGLPKVYGVIPSREKELPMARSAGHSLGQIGADACIIATEPGLSVAKNAGFRALPKGSPDDIIMFVDSDTSLQGDLTWFRLRPASEAFWIPRYECHADSLYSVAGCVFINGINQLRLWPASIGPCIIVRRWVAQRYKFEPRALLEDLWFGITLKRARVKSHLAPLRAHVQRRFSPPSKWKRTNRDVHGVPAVGLQA